MLESRRQAQIVEWLEDAQGCVVIKLTTNRGYGRTGWPDLLVLPARERDAVRFGAHFIETKTPHGRLSPAQRHRITTLRDLGYPVLIADGVDTVRASWGDETRDLTWWRFTK